MFGKHLGFKVFNDFNPSMLDRFAYENLQNWFNLLVEVEKFILSVENLSSLFMSILGRDVLWLLFDVNFEVSLSVVEHIIHVLVVR